MKRNLACALIASATVIIVGLLLVRKAPLINLDATSLPDAAPTTPVSPKQTTAAVARKTIPATERYAWAERLRARRALQQENLRVYALAGLYPRNTDTPDQRVPVFVDDRDTACAVGHLMRASGRESLVASIRDADNHIRVSDIQGGPALDWILTSGFTQEECARIQPSYEFKRRQMKQPDPRVRSHLLTVYHELVSNQEHSLEVALVRLEERLARGPVAEDCLQDVQFIFMAHDPVLDELVRR